MDAGGQLPGLGWSSVALSLASLGVVCLVAWGALRLLAGRGVGKVSGAIRIVARCPLEPRRSVYVIEAAGRCFLIGVGDGPMSVLAELDAERVKGDLGAASPVGFAEVLAGVLGRRPRAGAARAGAARAEAAKAGAAKAAAAKAEAAAGSSPPRATIEAVPPIAARAERL